MKNTTNILDEFTHGSSIEDLEDGEHSRELIEETIRSGLVSGWESFFRALDRFLEHYPGSVWPRHHNLEKGIGRQAIERLREARDINNGESTVGKLLERMETKI